MLLNVIKMRLIFFLLILPVYIDAFVVPSNALIRCHEFQGTKFQPTSTTSLGVVETFDGSSIVDPVVVSNVFWSSFQAKLVSMILGQILASIVASVVFGAVASAATSQLESVTGWVEGLMGSNKGGSRSPPQTNPFRKPGENTLPGGASSPQVDIDINKLIVCILIDIIGSSSEVIPVVGEITDVVWAPIAGVLLSNLFYGSKVLLVAEFTEEILPLIDFLPLASICWTIDTFYRDGDIAKVLGLGVYAPTRIDDDGAIDADAKDVKTTLRLPDEKKR